MNHTKNGTVFGKYSLLKELGRGGMGVVYLAEDRELKRRCALKVLLQNDKRAIERFIREARAVARLNHNNIIKIYEIGNAPRIFFTMEYIEGVPLTEKIGNMSYRESLLLFYKICDGVAYAHQNNIVHRDLKPGNIVIDKHGEPIILDFGLAKHTVHDTGITETGQMLGTPKYMAPEIAKGKEVGEKGDIYSLGVILYQMLTNHVPFDGENLFEILFQITTNDIIPPSRLNFAIKDKDIEIVCLKCLKKSPAERIASVDFLKREIQAIIDNKPIRTRPPSTLQKLKAWGYKNKALFVILSALSVISVFLTASLMFISQKRHQALVESSTVKLNSFVRNLRYHRKECENNIALFHYLGKVKQEYQVMQKEFFHASNDSAKKQALMEAIAQLQQNDIWNLQAQLDFFKFSVMLHLPRKKTLRVDVPELYKGYIASDLQHIISMTPDKLYCWKNDNNIPFFHIQNSLLSLPISKSKYDFDLFSHDGQTFIHEDNNVNLYSVKNRKKYFFHDKTTSSQQIIFCKNNRFVAFQDDSRGEIYLYNYRTSKLIHTFKKPGRQKSRICFSPKGNFLFLLFGGETILYNIATRKVIHRENSNYSIDKTYAIFSANEKNIFVFSRVGILKFNIDNKKFTKVNSGFYQSLHHLQMDYDQQFIIGSRNSEKGEILLFRSEESKDGKIDTNIRFYNAHKSHITHINSDHPHFIAVSSIDNHVSLHSPTNFAAKLSLLYDKPLLDLQLSTKNQDTLAVLTTTSYDEYVFPPRHNLSINAKTQNFIEKSAAAFFKSKESWLRYPIVGNSRGDVVVLPHHVGFFVWKKNNDTYTFSENIKLIQPRVFEIVVSSDGKQLIELRKNSLLTLFDTTDISKSKRIHIPHKSKENQVESVAFADHDKTLLYNFGKDIYTYNIQKGVSKKYIAFRMIFANCVTRVHIQWWV
ncbi:protein kinase [Candidatus Uabimicrobium amorphum]|uniref:Protein kinase n=1 Tax=Uabimicrobium amorphum TaxID=2596890 RepID=A0A5S9F1V5_UABAM|nr:WD40 repeat domain-containing serine/threonine protein kinase [Candidatus Uabimicrobium amorphum]BBM83015.1 protein kinase [Candidatus Uabimicrobium amorphum]